MTGDKPAGVLMSGLGSEDTGLWSPSRNGTNFTAAQKMDALNHLDHRMTMAVLPVTMFVAIETVVGFFGNIVVLYVFLFHYKHCNFRLFVLCLGVIDLISTLTTMPGEMVTQLNWYTYPNPTLCKVKSYFNMFTVSAEALALLTITTDRYLKVCWPFGFQISRKAAILIIVIIFTFATVVSSPVAFFWGTHTAEVIYMGVHIPVTVCEVDAYYVGKSDQVRYSWTMDCIISTSMAVMFVLCILVARRLVLKTNRFKSEPGQDRRPKISDPRTSDDSVTNERMPSPTSNDSGVVTGNDLSGMHLEHLDGLSSSPEASSSGVNAQGQSSSNQDNVLGKRASKKSFRTSSRRKIRSKTLIMFVLIIVFIITTVIYLTLLSFISKGILKELTDKQKTIYFFFFRLYFINSAINPIIYGVLDPHFKLLLNKCRTKRST